MLHISGFPLPIKKLRMQDMMQYLTVKQIFLCFACSSKCVLQLRNSHTLNKST